MVAIYHDTGPSSAAHERRVRLFFLIYGPLSIVATVVASTVWFWGALLICLLLLAESLELELLVWRGHDQTTACRWLGWLILARLVVWVPVILVLMRHQQLRVR